MLKRILIAIAVVFTTSAASVHAQEFDWRAHAGTELRGIMIQGPWIESARDHVADFELATGISVVLEVLPEAQAWDKIRIEMQAGSRDLDVFFNQTSRFGTEFVRNAWVEPLNEYLADPSRTNPDFDWEGDFLGYSRAAVAFDGDIIAIPTDRTLGPMMFYRRDVLEEYGVDVPTTLDELYEAAVTIYEASGRSITGFVNRGQGASATSHFIHVLHEFGGSWEDQDGNPTINTPEAIAAFEWYGRALRDSGSIAATAFGFPETTNAFLTGNAALSMELGINARNTADPAVSSVVGLVGFTPMVRGPGPESARSTEPCRADRPFGLSISSRSESKDAAWLFVQWMTGYEAQLDYLKASRVAARSSPWESEEFNDSLSPDAREYWQAQALASSFCYPTPGHAPPSIVDVGRARDVIGFVIETAILGGDVSGAANQAQAELVALREREQRGN
ncbi:MAG: extracellular solute-binding protein [Trueperaceae bacterium]|nr:extracellular solute-binding protein [Trueperaceae bacterium]